MAKSVRISKRSTPGRIFEGDKRESVISKAVAILSRWQLTKFQNEAICRTGLRQALCLAGHRWPVADAEAASIVSTALARLRAVRPTWEQGQPSYSIPRENCARCRGDLDVEQIARGQRFCSVECARFAFAHGSYAEDAKSDAIRLNAYEIIRKSQIAARACKHCKKQFRPAVDSARYCSTVCARHARGDLIAKRQCAQCGRTFHPRARADVGKFCSTACATAARTVLPVRECETCGVPFKPRKQGQVTCCRACTTELSAKKLPVTKCVRCGSPFQPKTRWAKFCSAKCRNRQNHEIEWKRITAAMRNP